MLISESEVILNTIPSPSASVAVDWPTSVVFSSIEYSLEDVITGLLSFTFVTLIVMSWVAELVPSLAVNVAV